MLKLNIVNYYIRLNSNKFVHKFVSSKNIQNKSVKNR